MLAPHAQDRRADWRRRLRRRRGSASAAWRVTIAPGHRFEATQALRQVLGRAVVWGMIDVNPAKQVVDNPQRRYTEKRPFESWAELAAVAAKLGPRRIIGCSFGRTFGQQERPAL